jgi:hypothetical protein
VNNPIADDRGIGVSKTAIGMVKGAMLLRVYHQTEATWRGERLAGSIRGPTHHVLPCEVRKWISKAVVG